MSHPDSIADEARDAPRTDPMIPNPEELFARHRDALEDFWGRREARPRFERRFSLFGRPVLVTSNTEEPLAAVELSRPLFSAARPVDEDGFAIRIAVRPTELDPGEPPEDLFTVIEYAGLDDWLTLRVGSWGQVFMDLTARRALVLLTPALAVRPDLVSRGVVNTIFTNLLFACGFGMLHATGLVQQGRVLLLLAPHNAGKSTTAVRLMLAGYRFMSDSQVYVAPGHGPLQLLGFPVGRVHLREQAAADVPELSEYLGDTVYVRGEAKFVLDLRAMAANHVETTAVTPRSVDLCLLERADSTGTHVTPIDVDSVLDAVMRNSLYYDTAESWRRNLEPIGRLLGQARCHRLSIGRDPRAIVDAIDRLVRTNG